MKVYSNATWTKIDDTKDGPHRSHEAAQAICDSLLNENTKDTPCSVRGVCLTAFVSEEEE